MGRGRVGAALTIALLAGCATGVPVERSVVVSGARFDAVRGEADLLVRTYILDAAGERREVVGAVCDVRSSLYATRVTTPSQLVLPNFGPQSPRLDFTCRAGELTGSGQQEIVTRWTDPPGYWGWPGYGPGGYWGGWGWYGPGYQISDYPNIAIALR